MAIAVLTPTDIPGQRSCCHRVVAMQLVIGSAMRPSGRSTRAINTSGIPLQPTAALSDILKHCHLSMEL